MQVLHPVKLQGRINCVRLRVRPTDRHQLTGLQEDESIPVWTRGAPRRLWSDSSDEEAREATSAEA